jgi:putative Mg2+ transporter-C (MgtC) family protein
METLWSELTGGLNTAEEAIRIVTRLAAAMLLGAVVGIQRERAGKPAGLRTHMLVSTGTALFVIVCVSVEMSLEGLSRVIQGLVTGIGFIGTGAILKLNEKLEVQGLTTAAGIWMTAAIGVTVGLGRVGIAIVGVLAAWMILVVFGYFEMKLEFLRSSGDGTPQ